MEPLKGLDLPKSYSSTFAPQTSRSLKSATTPCSSEPNSPGANDIDLSLIVHPIQWPAYIKRLVLFQVVAHASMASWCASAFIPALTQMSITFGRPIEEMSYLIGAYTFMMGFGVLAWNPVADHIGRRPVMLISLMLTIIATCGVAKSTTYATIMVARVFQGFGICAPCSLGAAYIKDMYASKDRGQALGLWTLGTTAGPFIGPFVSGFVAHHMKYTWIIWVEALILASLFILELLFLPESLLTAPCYRDVVGFMDILFQIPRSNISSEAKDALLDSINAVEENIAVRLNTFKHTLVCLLFPAVWICGLAFAVPYGYVSVGISSLFPTVYGKLYGFNSSMQGLLYLPMLFGSILAEAATGSFGDWLAAAPHSNFITFWVAKRNTTSDTPSLVPEMRLFLGISGILVSIGGLLWFGISVDMHLHWAKAAAASGVAAFGVQMTTSICFSYVIDCYPKSAKEIATVMNLFRVLSSFVVLFYNARLNNSVGYAWSFGIQSFVSAAFGLAGLCVLIVFGGRWRNCGASAVKTTTTVV